MKSVTLCCFAAAFAFAACKSDSTSSNPTPTSNGTLAKGNTFTTTHYDSTSTGTESNTWKDSVIATGLTIDSRLNVSETVHIDSTGKVTDSSYVYFAANGDAEFRRVSHGFSFNAMFPTVTWMKLPFGSQSSIELGAFDTTISFSGLPVNVHFALTSSGAGTGSFTFNGKTYSTKKAAVRLIASNASLGADTLASQTVSFASEIGWNTTLVSPAIHDAYGLSQQTSGSYEVLTDFKK